VVNLLDLMRDCLALEVLFVDRFGLDDWVIHRDSLACEHMLSVEEFHNHSSKAFDFW
jgi:hypothetical protein